MRACVRACVRARVRARVCVRAYVTHACVRACASPRRPGEVESRQRAAVQFLRGKSIAGGGGRGRGSNASPQSSAIAERGSPCGPWPRPAARAIHLPHHPARGEVNLTPTPPWSRAAHPGGVLSVVGCLWPDPWRKGGSHGSVRFVAPASRPTWRSRFHEAPRRAGEAMSVACAKLWVQ